MPLYLGTGKIFIFYFTFTFTIAASLHDELWLTKWIKVDYIGLHWTNTNQNLVCTLYSKHLFNCFREETCGWMTWAPVHFIHILLRMHKKSTINSYEWCKTFSIILLLISHQAWCSSHCFLFQDTYLIQLITGAVTMDRKNCFHERCRK